MNNLDHLWTIGLLAALSFAAFIMFAHWALISMRPTPSQAIGGGFLALAVLAVWALIAVEITTGGVFG